MKQRKKLTSAEFLALSKEDQKEYLKTVPIYEVKEHEKYDPHQNAITVYGDIDEYMESLGGIMWEDFQKKISSKNYDSE